jgi:hypothetical protein
MKIARVKATPLDVPVRIRVLGLDQPTSLSVCLVEVETDAGLVGHGFTAIAEEEVVAAAINDVAGPAIVGDDPLAHERVWEKLGIPVGRVRASPFCRTVETAQLAFGRAEPTSAVRGGPARPEDPARYAALRSLLGQAPTPGTNDVIVSHGNPFYGVAGPPYLAEGEAAVIQPTGEGFRVVARIRVDEWPVAR